MNSRDLNAFRRKIWRYYEAHGRHDLPWRLAADPYHIFVSEVMLQQTQVARVIPKYEELIALFPDFESLASAPTDKLLAAWQGLGYNRRALNMRAAARAIVEQHNGDLPNTYDALVDLASIGPNTAGSLLAFAFNKPVVFIETNIRRVYIDAFFDGSEQVRDAELLPLIEQSVPKGRAREWYWALMDYGAHLPKLKPNPNRASKHYVKQSKFTGSTRQLRGQIIALALTRKQLDIESVAREVEGREKTQIAEVLETLEREGFLAQKNGSYSVA